MSTVEKQDSHTAELQRIQIGDVATCRFTITESDVDAFVDLSKDDNPLHMDDRFARERGFQGRVAHGMLPLSMISYLIGTQLPGPGSLWMSQETQFVNPVSIGDSLEGKVTVEKISHAARVAVLATDVINIVTNKVVLRGTARVRIPQLERLAGDNGH